MSYEFRFTPRESACNLSKHDLTADEFLAREGLRQ